MRRLIASIAKKHKEPFQAICQLPYKHTVKLDGKNKTSIIYSPDYQISIDAKLKYPVYKFDTKLKSKKVKGLPMPPKRLKLTRPGTGDQTCSRASGFGLESTSKIRPRSPGASRFCPNVKNFCCKPHAMRKFVWAWDKHQTGYAVNIKQCGESPLYLTQYMVKWMLNTGLQRDSMTRNSKWCSKSANNLTICKGIFNDLIKKRREMMKDGGLDNYTGDYIACSRTINKFKTSAMCMACDADVQKFFNKTDKTIPVKSDYLNRLVRRCYTAKAFESNKLAPFYATLLKYSDVVRRDPTFVEIGTPAIVVPKKTNKASVKAKAKVMTKNAKKSDTGVSKKATAKAAAPKKATAKAAAPKKATAKAAAPKKATAKAAAPKKATTKAAAPKTASAKAAAKLRRLKDTSHVISRKNKKAQTTIRLFHPTKTELHKGKPIKKLMDPTKKYIYVAPKVEQQYWDKAYKLFDTNVTTCDAWFKAQKGTVAEKLQRYKSEVLTLKGTPCEKFAYQLSMNAVNMNVLTDLWKWQNDEWKNTYSLFKAIGNSVSLYKWNSYMSSLCYSKCKVSNGIAEQY
jgi:hypothetical protein